MPIIRQHYLSKTHHQKGDKHPDIYGRKKEILPCPKNVVINVSIPVECNAILLEMYPDAKSVRYALRQYVIDSLKEKAEGYKL